MIRQTLSTLHVYFDDHIMAPIRRCLKPNLQRVHHPVHQWQMEIVSHAFSLLIIILIDVRLSGGF